MRDMGYMEACQALLIQVAMAMNMQIHDWSRDEIDISLNALSATDSRRIGWANHTHTYTHKDIHTHTHTHTGACASNTGGLARTRANTHPHSHPVSEANVATGQPHSI